MRALPFASLACLFACSAEPPALSQLHEINLAKCSSVPTSVDFEDTTVDFVVPPGLMPDAQLDGQPAQLHLRRAKPVYAHGKCPDVPTRAALFVHGRTIPGTVFDVRDPVTGGRGYSLLEEAAWGGIVAFAVDLLGYGGSTRFTLDDPCNASRTAYVPAPGGWTCPAPDGICDQIGGAPPFSGDQQALLIPNPLGQRCDHSSNVRFARVDTWTRDLRQAVDHILTTVKPDGDKITLVGWSLGGVHVARYLDPSNTAYGNIPQDNISKIDRAILIDTLTTFTPSDVEAGRPHPSFPLSLSGNGSVHTIWNLPTKGPSPTRATICGETADPGVPEQLLKQQLAVDPIGSTWGAAGLSRSPTFNSYGLTLATVASFPVPILVVHGRDDGLQAGAFPWPTGCNIYKSISGAPKMLLTVDCASHGIALQSCSGARCGDESSRPYGQTTGPYRGPRATIQAAVVEWITHGTVDGASSGPLFVDASGYARPHTALADLLAAGGACPASPP
jgi:pimeloyl-ACP methyl ester carboxylesterase